MSSWYWWAGGVGLRCEICPDYHVCNACNHKDRIIIIHPHKLTDHPSIAELDPQNNEATHRKLVEVYTSRS